MRAGASGRPCRLRNASNCLNTLGQASSKLPNISWTVQGKCPSVFLFWSTLARDKPHSCRISSCPGFALNVIPGPLVVLQAIDGPTSSSQQHTSFQGRAGPLLGEFPFVIRPSEIRFYTRGVATLQPAHREPAHRGEDRLRTLPLPMTTPSAIFWTV